MSSPLSDRMEEILDRFDEAWNGPTPPRIEEYLAAGDPDERFALLIELVHIDLERRLAAGEWARLEVTYPRQRFPELYADVSAIVALVKHEFELRRRNEPNLIAAEYLERFPQCQTQLLAELTVLDKGRDEKQPQGRFPNWDELSLAVEGGEAKPSPALPEITEVVSAPMELDPRRYELIEALGKGGMGEVYRCCDPALGRDLAIKVMDAALRGRAPIEQRFLREARITGSLQHPSIVAVHNLGRLADGRLHYTMRLVRGHTLADILVDEGGKPERLPHLLSIFEKICQAVAYAHSKRVIHRDLKPANVMVGRFGEVQVMDWGLAKLMTAEDDPAAEETPGPAETRIHTEAADTPVDLSRLGCVFGTYPYMPSEQARGKWNLVDERADVFALGSILCEMMTGEPAYIETSNSEVQDRAERGDVAEALQRVQQCGADTALTWLCCECLSLRREDRPRDAGVVAQRVAEYQAQVQERLRQAELERAEAQAKAREDRKRRRWVIAFVLVLLAGATLCTWQAVRATLAEGKALDNERQAIAERDEKVIALGKAEKSEADTKAVLEYFQNKLLSAGRPKNQEGGLGKDVTLRKAVDKAAKDIADSFKDRPLVEASIRGTLGTTYWHLGDYPQAIQQHERALALRESTLGPDHSDTLTSRNNLAIVYRNAGRIDEAIRLHEQILKRREATLGPNHPDTLTSCNNLATAYFDADRTNEAIRLYEQTLKRREATLGDDHPDALNSRNNLAAAYWSAGRTDEAIHLLEQNLKQREATLGIDHPDTLTSRNNLAEAYRTAGRFDDAIRLHEQTLKQRETTLGDDHPDTFNSRQNLASAYEDAGRTQDAIRLYEQTLKEEEAKLGPDHPATLQTQNGLANAYRAAGRLDEAIRLYEQTLRQREAKLGADHNGTLTSRNNLANAYRDAGRSDEAIRLYQQTLKQREATLAPDHPDTLTSRSNLAVAYLDAGRFDEAIHLHQQTLKQREAKLGPEHPATLTSRNNLAVAYLDANRTEEAIRLHEQNSKLYEAKLAPDHPRALSWRSNLADAYDRAERFVEAEALYRTVLEQTRKRSSAEDTATARQMFRLGRNLLHQHKYADAEPLLRDSLKIRQAKQPDLWTTFNTHSLFGAALLGQKKYAEAEPLLVQGYEGMKQRQDKIPQKYRLLRLSEALERLVQLYEGTKQKEKAADWRKQLQEVKAAQKKPKP